MSEKRFVDLAELCALKKWSRDDALHQMVGRGLPVYSGKAKIPACTSDEEIDDTCRDLIFNLDDIDQWEKRGQRWTTPAGKADIVRLK